MTTPRDMQHQQGGDMDAQLENVLEAYATVESAPNRVALTEWIRKYPQFARELIDFTARWQLLEWAGDVATPVDAVTAVDLHAEEDERLILRGISAAQSVFYAKRAERQSVGEQQANEAQSQVSSMADAPITSLLAAAKRAGLSQDDLMDRAGLSDGLFRKIDRRLIDPLTIPIRVLSELASAVQHSVTEVTAYIQRAPVFGSGAEHRASQPPSLPQQREDFFDAVQRDLTIDDSRRQELLSLSRPSSEERGGTEEG